MERQVDDQNVADSLSISELRKLYCTNLGATNRNEKTYDDVVSLEGHFKLIFPCSQAAYPLWWPSWTKALQTDPTKMPALVP